MPAVSLIMPVFNRADMVGQAVRSVVAQSFTDWELILVDDGSSDGSVAAAEAIDDRRVRIVRHATNRGISAARNSGLAQADGRYIAWLDSDDLSRPDRFARQVGYLDMHTDIAMIGSAAGKLDGTGRRRRGIRRPPMRSEDIAAWLLFRSAFQQSSIMGHAEVLRDHPYDTDLTVCEDLDVFLRLSHHHRLANLPTVLVDRRVHTGQTVRQHQARIRAAKMHLYVAPLRALGLPVDDDALARHVLLGKASLEGVAMPDDFLARTDAWLRAMRAGNAARSVLYPAALDFATGWFWLVACRAAAGEIGRAAALAAFARSPLAGSLAGRGARRWLAGNVAAAIIPDRTARPGSPPAG